MPSDYLQNNNQTDINYNGVNTENDAEYNQTSNNFDIVSENKKNTDRYIDYAKLAQNLTGYLPDNPYPSHRINSGYNIRDDKNYAWDIPKQYDRRGNLASLYNNFKKINKENPISYPISTGNIITDNIIMRNIAKRYPYIAMGLNAYKFGYMGKGYYDNLKRAYIESHRDESIFDDD